MKIDTQLFFLILILSLVGLYFFYGVSLPYSTKIFNNPLYYFKKFLIFNFFLPLLMFFIGYFMNWLFLMRIAKIIFIVNIIFLILPFFDFFKLPNQSTARWFYLKGISFQPSEFMKLSLLLFLTSTLPLIKKNLSYFYISLIIIFLTSLIIFIQPALSTLLIILTSTMGALITINFKLKNFFIFSIILLFFILAGFLWNYRLERVTGIFISNDKGLSFQLNQSRLAIGSGGLLGKGLGNSDLKLIGLPLMISDNIFSVYAEETGFIGSIILIILFVYLIFRIIYLGYYNNNELKKFFSYGVACWLSIQVFVHLMANLTISTGVPLPFFSYGPSSQIAIMTALGIISGFKK
ncbi:MAG: stage V sporulation protein E [Candidatus Parcubacteria bacterium]|nr:MAG: stage V sporulation protein E [Candidatus Parcubacteria bacterium]